VKNVYDYMIARYGNTHTQPNLYELIEKLNEKINVLEEKYSGALEDIKRLEEENIETTNCLYEIINSTEAIDRRIDIIAEHCGVVKDV